MWCKFIEAAHLCCKIYGKASTKASEVQDGNNNELLLFSAVQHSSGMQNGCSSLNNTTKKGALKHLAAEVNELLLIRQRAFLSCVTMINVLYESLAVPVKLWNLKVQIITVNFSEAVRKRPHDSLHPLHKSLVSTGLWWWVTQNQSCTVLSSTTNQLKTKSWFEVFITVPLDSKWHQPHRSKHENRFQFAKTRHTPSTP